MILVIRSISIYMAVFADHGNVLCGLRRTADFGVWWFFFPFGKGWVYAAQNASVIWGCDDIFFFIWKGLGICITKHKCDLGVWWFFFHLERVRVFQWSHILLTCQGVFRVLRMVRCSGCGVNFFSFGMGVKVYWKENHITHLSYYKTHTDFVVRFNVYYVTRNIFLRWVRWEKSRITIFWLFYFGALFF